MSYKPCESTSGSKSGSTSGSTNGTYKINYRKYEDNLVMGVVAVLLGVAYKGVTKSEILPVSGSKKMIETFLVVTIASIIGEKITDKMKSEGYIK